MGICGYISSDLKMPAVELKKKYPKSDIQSHRGVSNKHFVQVIGTQGGVKRPIKVTLKSQKVLEFALSFVHKLEDDSRFD